MFASRALRRRPPTLQTQLMSAVIGIVSLILVIVAVTTSVFLGRALEGSLDAELRSTADQLTRVTQYRAGMTQAAPSPAQILDSQYVPRGLALFVVGSADASGSVVSPLGRTADVDADTVREAVQTVRGGENVMTVDSYGSYQLTAVNVDSVRSSLTGAQTPSFTMIIGLPRTEIQHTLSSLFTVIALATAGGLILLAVTTAIAVRVSLRPLRAVATTATRVANQPLDRGDVSIQERVPEAEADPHTEIGRVGAALNTLLDHVDTSLAARQRNEERMRQFVADASHELRTPLASIRGYSELSLRSTDLPETAHTALERIQAQSLRMTRLVEDLLLLARLDEGQELVHTPVDLTLLAIEGVEDARPTAHDHVWELDVPAEPVTVLGDAGRLQQVIANLLANARTHTPAGTRVTVTLTMDEASAVLRIHDDGPGIDPSVREELFARFARGDRSRTRATGGTGLGLAITKAIVEGHGGTITVESEPGSTAFEVRLPRLRPAAPEEAGAAPDDHARPDAADSGSGAAAEPLDGTPAPDAPTGGQAGGSGQHLIVGNPSSDAPSPDDTAAR